jgi:hypothetical protein
MELCINDNFYLLDENQLINIEGGSFWGFVSGVASCIAGAAIVIGSAALLLAPEPTSTTKFAGGAGIFIGVATFLGGCATIGNNN